MITFPATIHCSKEGCQNTTTVTMEYMGFSFYSGTYTEIKTVPDNWSCSLELCDRTKDLCPEHSMRQQKAETHDQQ